MLIFEPRYRCLPLILISLGLTPNRRGSLTFLKHIDLPRFGGSEVIYNLPNGIAIWCRSPGSLYCCKSVECFKHCWIIPIRPHKHTIEMCDESLQ